MDDTIILNPETEEKKGKGKAKKGAQEMVEVYLPRNNSGDKIQQEFYSLNGKNYLIKRGVSVMVPKAVKKLIDSNRRDEDKAAEYEESLSSKSSPDDKA